MLWNVFIFYDLFFKLTVHLNYLSHYKIRNFQNDFNLLLKILEDSNSIFFVESFQRKLMIDDFYNEIHD